MTRTRSMRRVVALVAAFAIIAAACSSAGDDSSSSGTATSTAPDTAGGDTPQGQGSNPPPANPFLAKSVVPIGHFDPAQSDSETVPGPTGPTAVLGEDELTYTHLGPAHFGIAISSPYPDGRRVIWTNGGDRISKLDYDTLEVLAELPLPGTTPMTAAEADEKITTLDSEQGDDLANTAVELATEYLVGLAGVYYLLDVDNTLFVGGSDSIIAYHDVDPGDPASPIEVRDEWTKPEEIGGNFVGANLTFDGRIVVVTDEGWLAVVSRDFTEYDAIRLVGAENARQHNEDMIAAGFRSGAASWVRNSIAVGDQGDIYIVSFDHVHKVMWDGERLSTDPADGAWTEPYRNGTGAGSGATPTLMGFGDEDRFVVITDGDELMNVVLFWRDEIPEGWQPPAGAPSDRIAGQLPADMGGTRTSIQTEQSVVVAGYGALVVNNDPASVPDGFPAAALRALVGYGGAEPAFTPHGVQKFAWDPDGQEFTVAWTNTEISSANSVPVVSTGSNIVYTVGARDGRWGLEGIDWESGESAFHYETGSNRYNSLFSGVSLDQDGRVVHTTTFGIVRYEPTP